MERRELEFLKSLAFFIEANNILEVGVQRGDMAVFLAAAAKLNSGKYLGVDLWETHGLKNQFNRVGSLESVKDRIINEVGIINFDLVKLNTLENKVQFTNKLKEFFPNGIDLAFIDACHSYYVIASDFFSVYPLMAIDGVVVFHDTLRIDGCREFMLDLHTKYYDGTFDLIDLPFGSGERRCGVSILSKRAFPTLPIGIDEVCGSLSEAKDIEAREVAWYENEIYFANKNKKVFNLTKESLITDNIGFYNRKKFS